MRSQGAEPAPLGFVLIGLVGILFSLFFVWLWGVELKDLYHYREHGVSATGLVVANEQESCDDDDYDPYQPPPDPPAPPPPAPPVPPLRYLHSDGAGVVPADIDVRADGSESDVCGTSMVEVEIDGKVYEREFDIYLDLGEEVEVLIAPGGRTDFMLRSETDTSDLVVAWIKVGWSLLILVAIAAAFRRMR